MATESVTVFSRCGSDVGSLEVVELSRTYAQWADKNEFTAYPGQSQFIIATTDRPVSSIRHNRQHIGGTCPRCGLKHYAERKIYRPRGAKDHKCDGRCLAAKGPNCECSCRGKNHGAGS